MSVSEHVAKGDDDNAGAEERSLLEEVCDTLHHTHWDSLTMAALFRGVDDPERATLIARAEAHRKERYGVEPRKNVVAKANELARELEEGDGDE